MTQAKRISIFLIALVGLMTVTNAAQAKDYDFKFGGLYYKMDLLHNLKAKVVPEKASYPYYSDDASKPKGYISIPQTISSQLASLTVTEIGDHAFSGCKGLKSVTIPSSVYTIGKDAFNECSWMTNIHISGNGLRVISVMAISPVFLLESNSAKAVFLIVPFLVTPIRNLSSANSLILPC